MIRRGSLFEEEQDELGENDMFILDEESVNVAKTVGITVKSAVVVDKGENDSGKKKLREATGEESSTNMQKEDEWKAFEEKEESKKLMKF